MIFFLKKHIKISFISFHIILKRKKVLLLIFYCSLFFFVNFGNTYNFSQCRNSLNYFSRRRKIFVVAEKEVLNDLGHSSLFPRIFRNNILDLRLIRVLYVNLLYIIRHFCTQKVFRRLSIERIEISISEKSESDSDRFEHEKLKGKWDFPNIGFLVPPPLHFCTPLSFSSRSARRASPSP